MNGKYLINVKYGGVYYEFIIERNLTVIRGDSATGKTFLLNSISEYINTNGKITDIHVKRYVNDSYYVDANIDFYVMDFGIWKLRNSIPDNAIIFIDENNDFVKGNEFASYVKESGNYFVIVTREDVINPIGSSLPISINSVISFKMDNRYPKFNKSYKMYEDNTLGEMTSKPDIIITEDTGFAFKLLEQYYSKFNVKVISSKGNGNLVNEIRKYNGKKVFAIGDGAAIAAYINELNDYVNFNKEDIKLFLPESFEWLILKSGVCDNITPIYYGTHINKLLKATFDYINYKESMSWEQYYTTVLTTITRKTYLQYDKSEDKFNDSYLNEEESKLIKKQIPIKINNELTQMGINFTSP